MTGPRTWFYSASTASFDLHTKFRIYRRAGVREYLVWQVWDNQFHWFVLQDGQYVSKVADADGVLSSDVFPGLRLKLASLLAGNMAEVMAVLEQGLASPEHAAFCAAQAT